MMQGMPSDENTTATIVIVGVLFMAMYALTGPWSVPRRPTTERFVEQDHALLPPDRIAVAQGIAVAPTASLTPMRLDPSDPTIPSVDGTEGAPKSSFMFAYNRCSLDCCADSPYSCSGGCVCMTKSQRRYIASRGNNVHKDGCVDPKP